MTPFQQAQQWAKSGFLDSLPAQVEYEIEDSTGIEVTTFKPKQGILGNLEQISKVKNQKDMEKYHEQLAEIIMSIKHCVKEGII